MDERANGKRNIDAFRFESPMHFFDAVVVGPVLSSGLIDSHEYSEDDRGVSEGAPSNVGFELSFSVVGSVLGSFGGGDGDPLNVIQI